MGKKSFGRYYLHKLPCNILLDKWIIKKIISSEIKTTDITFFITLLTYCLIPITLGLATLKEKIYQTFLRQI